MNKNLNLQPLQEFLTMGITPEELSSNLDEMLFDYIRLIVSLQLEREESGEDAFIHLETNHFIYILKELRDTLRQCVN